MPNKYRQEYYQKNKERIKKTSRQWIRSEKGKAYHRKYYLEHKTYFVTKQRKYTNNLKIEVLAHYGRGKCACVKCGESRLACLSIDHINSGGGKHRRDIGMGLGHNFYLWLKRNNYPDGFQTLCMNCQYVKRVIERECG